MQEAENWDFPITGYPNYDEMIQTEANKPVGERVDYMLIVTPNHVHFDPAVKCIEAGIPVFCEKPLTVTLEESDKLVEAVKKAIRLNPFPPNWYWHCLGFVYCHAGMYEEAIAACKKALRVQPDNLPAHLRLAAAYSLLGREEEARAEAAEVLRIESGFSLTRFAKAQPYKYEADADLFLNALGKAGLK